MGFFTKDAVPGLGSALAPLSQDRIKAALERSDWTYSVDPDGDIFAPGSTGRSSSSSTAPAENCCVCADSGGASWRNRTT